MLVGIAPFHHRYRMARDQIGVLTDSGALSTSGLERVIVDGSHIDQKKRGIFDMRETQQPLMHLLNRSELKDRYGKVSGAVDLVVY